MVLMAHPAKPQNHKYSRITPEMMCAKKWPAAIYKKTAFLCALCASAAFMQYAG